MFFVAAAAVLAAVFSFGSAAWAEGYRLTQEDRVELRVGHWNAAEQRFEHWAGISGEYSVNPEGHLSIAIAGQVPAAGKSTEELVDEIAVLLQRRIGLPEAPAVSLEIVSYRPIYVGGSVQTPGTYPFRFGMTVQQAVTVAGGPPRVDQAAGPDTTQAIRLAGEIRQHVARLDELEAEEARLLAELATFGDSDFVEEPEFVAGGGTSGALEADILASNREALGAQRESILELQDLLRERIARLGEEMQLRNRQIELVRAELVAVEELRERGLAVNARVTALMNALNDNETRRIQLEVAQLTAEQQLNGASRDQFELFDTARLQRLGELKATQSDITQLRHRLDTARQLYSELVAWDVGVEPTLELPEPEYRVTRFVDGTAEALLLGQTDLLRPGDTLIVAIDPAFGLSSN